MFDRDVRNAFTDAVGQYVWITIEKPLVQSVNPHGLAEIKKLTVLGYPLPEEDVARIKAETPLVLEETPENRKEEREMKKDVQSAEVPRRDVKVERHS